MVDPVSFYSALVTTLQFVLQLKDYIRGKKKRKQEKLQLQAGSAAPRPPIPQQQHQIITPSSSRPVIVRHYHICYHMHEVFPAAYYPPPGRFAYPDPFNQIRQPSNGGPYNHIPQNRYPQVEMYNHSASSSRRVPRPAYYVEPPSANCRRPPPPPHLSHDWLGLLGGSLTFLDPQKPPNVDNSGRVYANQRWGKPTASYALIHDQASSYRHWKSLMQAWPSSSSAARPVVVQSTIAVVDLTRGNIDMFVKEDGTYARYYRINRCDVEVFQRLFRDKLVFEGEIQDQKLQYVSEEIRMVEIGMPAGRVVWSTNSWMSLGIYEDGVEEVVNDGTTFVQTVRGAVLGLMCGLYEDPSGIDLETAMELAHINGRDLEIMRVTAAAGYVLHPRQRSIYRNPHLLTRRHDCSFSVYSLGEDAGWAAQDVLLG